MGALKLDHSIGEGARIHTPEMDFFIFVTAYYGARDYRAIDIEFEGIDRPKFTLTPDDGNVRIIPNLEIAVADYCKKNCATIRYIGPQSIIKVQRLRFVKNPSRDDISLAFDDLHAESNYHHRRDFPEERIRELIDAID